MYALLTALPWVGRELYEKKENDLDRIMASMEVYLRKRNTAHVAALRVWNCDTPHPQVVIFKVQALLKIECHPDIFDRHIRMNIWIACGPKFANFALTSGKRDIYIGLI